MVALIDITSSASSNLQKNSKDNANEEIKLLKQKIEDSIIKHKSIIIGIATPVMECRNTIFPDDYEIGNNNIYLNNGNFELHINLNEVEIEDSFEDEFVFIYKEMEIRLYFLD